MKRIDRYNEHLLEKEFKSIVAGILLIAETQTSDNTFEWDLREPNKTFNIKDKKDFDAGDTIEFDIEQKKKLKDYVDFVKSKTKRFVDYIREPDADLPSFDLPTQGMKELLKKLVAMAPTKEEAFKKVKEYFDRFVYEMASLPYEIKKSLLKKFVYIFLAFIPLYNLIPDNNLSTKDGSILKEIRTEVESKKADKKGHIMRFDNESVEQSSFEVAQEFVSVEEGGYTDFRKDKGNWTSNQIGGGCLIGTNHGIAAPTLINSDMLPSGKEGKLFIMCYGSKSNYRKLCGDRELTFAEQWEKDTKNITRAKDLEVKWKKIMENLSYETALDIFENQYWNAQNLGLLINQSIANILYDGCVNQGQGAMANVLEEAATKLGAEIEGNVFSEENISIINKLDQEKLFQIIKEIREEMYRNNDRFDDFGDGWLDRLSRIEFGDDSNNNIA